MSFQDRVLGDLLDFFDHQRVPLNSLERETRQGEYRYYGAQGIIDHIDGYIFDGEYVLIAEDGANLVTRNEPIAFLVQGQFWVNNHAHIVRGKAGIADNRFVVAILNNVNIAGYVTGAAQPKLSQQNLRCISIRVPDFAGQQGIADLLSAYDDLIENNRRRMTLLEEAARQLYQEWFVRLRFPGYEHTCTTDGVPEGWERASVAALVERGWIDLQTGPFGTQLKASDYCEIGTPVINVRNIGYGQLRAEKLEYLPDNIVDHLDKHVLKFGDIVFGRKGAVDRHLLVSPAQDGWVQGSDCIRLRSTSDHVSTALLSLAFREGSHKEWILTQCSNKATMASLNQDVLGRIVCVLPQGSVLRAFSDFATDILSQQAVLQRQSEKLRAARDLLLPRLMSGEIAV